MSRFNKKKSSGFTLVELLVSITISVAILSVVILNQSKYTSASSLSNIAQSIAADLTLAQTYGTSVKQLSSNNFNTAYGLHFRTTAGGGVACSNCTQALNTDYVFFADSNRDGKYGGATSNWVSTSAAACPSPAGECLTRTRIGSNNVFVGAFCYIPATGGACASNFGSGVTAIHRIDVVFSRPKTEAILTLYSNQNPGTILGAGIPIQGVGVKIQNGSSSGPSKWICVYKTGQISVQDLICS